MRTLLKTFSALFLALALASVSASASASTLADAYAGIDNLRALTASLPVTKASKAASIRKDLYKKLDKAVKYLEKAASAQKASEANDAYYKAALEIYHFGEKLEDLVDDEKVGETEGLALDDAADVVVGCIVDIYYPDNN